MTGLIPRAFIDEVISQTDIVELIDSYIPLKKRGNSFLACCPFHNEKTPSFNVVAKKQFYHCFGCGASGNVISFVMNYLQQNFIEAVETLATKLGREVPHEAKYKSSQHTVTLYQLLNQVTQHYQKNILSPDNLAQTYLIRRGVNEATAKKFQLGYAPDGWHGLENAFRSHKKELLLSGMLIQNEDGKIWDRYRQRLMFPIHDRQGRVIGFGGRALMDDQKPKYLNSPETVIFQKSRELYGLHQLLDQKKSIEYIIVVEGYMDVIALAQHGIANVVATLGTATSHYHIQLLAKHTHKIIFCFDGDEAGKQAAWRALESTLPHLNSGLEAFFIFLPEEHDPDSLVRQEGHAGFITRLEESIPLNRYFWDTLQKNIDTSSHGGKTHLLQITKPFLKKISDGPYKQLLLDELARIMRIEAHRLTQFLQEEKLPDIQHAPEQTISRSPIRLAIALLLQHADLLREAYSVIDINELDERHELLKSLISQLIQHPGSNTAQLIEPWRDTPMFDPLVKLAAWDHQVPETAIVKEFKDIICFLTKKKQDETVTRLIELARHRSLNEGERLQLQTLLKQRHHIIHE